MNKNLVYLDYELTEWKPNLLSLKRSSKILQIIGEAGGVVGAVFSYIALLRSSERGESSKVVFYFVLAFLSLTFSGLFPALGIRLRKVIDKEMKNAIQNSPEGQKLLEEHTRLAIDLKRYEQDLKLEFEKIIATNSFSYLSFSLYCDYLIFGSYDKIDFNKKPHQRFKNLSSEEKEKQKEELYLAKKETNKIYINRVNSAVSRLRNDIEKNEQIYMKLFKKEIIQDYQTDVKVV